MEDWRRTVSVRIETILIFDVEEHIIEERLTGWEQGKRGEKNQTKQHSLLQKMKSSRWMRKKRKQVKVSHLTLMFDEHVLLAHHWFISIELSMMGISVNLSEVTSSCLCSYTSLPGNRWERETRCLEWAKRIDHLEFSTRLFQIASLLKKCSRLAVSSDSVAMRIPCWTKPRSNHRGAICDEWVYDEHFHRRRKVIRESRHCCRSVDTCYHEEFESERGCVSMVRNIDLFDTITSRGV